MIETFINILTSYYIRFEIVYACDYYLNNIKSMFILLNTT